MKLVNYLHITILLSLLALISSCTDEDIVQKTQYDVVEGVPVKIALNFNVEKSRISTRSASSSTLENTVNSLYIIAFHGQDVWARDFRDNVNGINNGAIDQLDIKSGTGIQLYAIANVNSGVGNLNKDALDAVTTYNEFLNLTTKLVDPLSTERMGFLMLGQLKATDGTSNIAIDRDGSILSGNTKIELQRLDARISFFVKAENSTYQDMKFEPKYYTVEQIPQASYLVPHDVDYDDDFASMEAAQARNYFDTDSEFEGTDEDYNGQYDFFEFYLLENRKETANPIKEGDNTKYETESLYALREKRKVSETEKPDGSKPGQEYVAGDFLFAPENSTYVKIYGTLTYTAMEEGIQKFYNANVCYTVHLGSTGSDANDVDLVNNYDTERNVWYRYYVTITGLNSLKVEVKDDKEERPGAEGDVIVGGGEVKDIDAHYGRQKFSLTREAVLSGLSWAVSTPFQSGLKAFNMDYFLDGVGGDVITDEAQLADVEGLQTDLTLNDYKWVQFAINAECVDHNASHVYVKYPGYSAYSGGSGNNNPAPAFGGNGIQSSYYNKTVKLYDVNQLLNHLYVEANKTNSQIFLDDSGSVSSEDNATVTITAYIDEYIYKYKPTEVFYEEPDAVQEGDPDLLLWKDVVNGENRMLHICESGAEYSPDGNSSWAESVITFSQRPVYTFYDPASNVETAWGTESLMETDEALPIGSYSRTSSINYPNTADNGRENQLNFLNSENEIGNLKWTDVLSLDEDEYGKLQGTYNSIWYACIGRNRDLNGNNVIDANEIRWYLASVDQLTDLWIGEEAVPNAKLYPLDPQGTELVPYVHVASSTYFGNSSNSPWVIWAEEGASRGQYYAGGDEKDENGQTASSERYYRCVRNLGLSLDHISDTPADYVISTENKTRTVGTVWNQTTYKEHWIDVTRLERNTRRSILVGQPLPNNDVTERSRNNRPYDKFAVLVEENSKQAIYPEAPEYDRWGNDISENGSWTTYYTSESNGSPCPTGYRIPNQRELMLMYTTFPDLFSSTSTSWMYMAKTGFGWKNHVGYGEHRAGFAYDRGNLRLIDKVDQPVKVRCVRDVEPGEQ